MTKPVSESHDGPGAASTWTHRLASSSIRVDVSALTHPGLVRANNEDQFFVSQLTRSLETILTSLPDGTVPERADEVNFVMAVADGMGGHAAGEVASRMAISALVSLALDIPDWFFRVDPEHAPEIERRARRAVQAVAAQVVAKGRENEALQGMGTTLTAARSFGDDLLVIHVGDSRAYMFRAGRLHRLTKDHTYVQLLVDTGQLSASEAATSRMRHVLTNVLGGNDGEVHVDIDLLRLEDGDRLLLCSDGLTDLVDDATLASTLAAERPSAAACARLVQLALEGGGRDNITVIVAEYAIPGLPAPASGS